MENANSLLRDGRSSLDIAAAAVSQLEDCSLFNCGHGAVFTRAGSIELEASVMVSRGYKKRGAAVSLVNHVKNPILFVKEMLKRGEHDMLPDKMLEEGDAELEREYTSAQGHVHISGKEAERLAKAWDLELVEESYFWTRKRWEEHRRGLKRSGHLGKKQLQWTDLFPLHSTRNSDPGWDGIEYLPQGTVGCVALDCDGILCVATSTGGLTNKLPGRIGDTPTFGSGFWAEESDGSLPRINPLIAPALPPTVQSLCNMIPESITSAVRSCLPALNFPVCQTFHQPRSWPFSKRGIALSGTGNGDTFMRIAACRTAAAMVVPVAYPFPQLSLAKALKSVAGTKGLLQQSAGNRWGQGTGEGEGGIIGIELHDDHGKVGYAFNCGGMFRAWVDKQGKTRIGVFEGDDGDPEEMVA